MNKEIEAYCMCLLIITRKASRGIFIGVLHGGKGKGWMYYTRSLGAWIIVI
jgi:hypothetical protein